jgi:hypothetical protein
MIKETEEILHATGETVEYARQYIKQQGEYIRLEVAERSSKVVSTLATVAVISFFAMMVLIMLSLSLGFWLGQRWGSYPKAFLFLSGAYFILALGLYLFKRVFITRPILNLILDSFFEQRGPGQA